MLQRYVCICVGFRCLICNVSLLCESTWLLIYVLCALSALSIECFYLQRFLCGSLAGSFVITWLVDSCILNEGFLHSCGASLSRSPPLSASPLSCFLSLSCSVSQPLSLYLRHETILTRPRLGSFFTPANGRRIHTSTLFLFTSAYTSWGGRYVKNT